jgi:hypothetical protein
MTLRATLALMLALAVFAPACAMVETVVVTADFGLSTAAMALDRDIAHRLTPDGKAFVTREVAGLRTGAITYDAVAVDAAHACKTAFVACQGRDAKALAAYTLIEDLATFDIYTALSRDPAFLKATRTAAPYMLRGDDAGFQRAVLLALPARQRTQLVAVRARVAQIRAAACASLADYGLRNGCTTHPSSH